MGFRNVALANLAVGIRAGGIEVTQRDEVQRKRRRAVFENLLAEQLGDAVGIDRCTRLSLIHI